MATGKKYIDDSTRSWSGCSWAGASVQVKIIQDNCFIKHMYSSMRCKLWGLSHLECHIKWLLTVTELFFPLGLPGVPPWPMANVQVCCRLLEDFQNKWRLVIRRVCRNSVVHPYHPWDWYIYRSMNGWFLWWISIGKYTSPMDSMG